MQEPIIANGGVQMVPQIAAVQYVYLDFDGEVTDYNGEILSVENVEVADSLLTQTRIADIVTELNALYADQNVIFVTERPTVAGYSTIFIGKTDAFDEYGNFAGLAETIDKGNQNSTDKAFVMLNAANTNAEIISTIAHETDHLLGTLDHGGSGLAAYATYYYIESGQTSTGLVLSGDSIYISSGGVANSTTVNAAAGIRIYDGGEANSTILQNYGQMYISSGGVANNTTVNPYGNMTIFSSGTANNTTVSNGHILIYSGGIHRGSLQIESGTDVKAYEGSIIDFTLTGRTTQDDFLINDLSLILLTPTYTITVAADQVYGTYKLAQGAENFTGSITIGDGSVNYGTLTVNGETLESNDVKYSLTQSNGNLLLNIAEKEVPPAVFVYSGGTVTSSGRETSGVTLAPGGNNSMYISSYGIANSTTVNSGGGMYISSGGTANSTTINSGGNMTIYSGGAANDTTVSGGGTINIKGGVTNDTTVNSGGRMYVYGEANSTTVNSDGYMSIYSGGTANDTTINYGGDMHISSGGVANDTTINYGGGMFISSGGTATGIVENGGRVHVDISTNVTFASNTISKVVLSDYNEMTVHKNTVANNTIINSGVMEIYSGGIANDTVINSAGSMYVQSGGTANSTTVNPGGSVYIGPGGTASIVFNPWQGYIHANTGETVEYLERDANIYYGNKESGVVAKYDSTDGLNINHNSAIIYSGGIANNTSANYWGYMYISSGGTANDTTLDYTGCMYVSSGGTANNTTVNASGFMNIEKGGTANNITVNAGGRINISSNGTATQIIENGGYIEVKDGANVTFASNTFGGFSLYNDLMTVHQNTVANNITVKQLGSMFICSGGTANNTIVNASGWMIISSGGTVNNTTINSGGSMRIFSNGAATDTAVNSGGLMIVSSGGGHRGSLQIADGAKVSAYSGAVIDFAIAGRTAQDDFLINDLSLISGAPTYTITVAADQALGTYKLAQGAENFTGTLSIGDGSVNYGKLTVNGEYLEYNDSIYVLTQSDGSLLLDLQDANAPRVFIYSSGTVTSSGREISGATLAPGGNNSMYISSYGIANSTTINSGGRMYVSSGGTANNTTVNSGGRMYISSGATATAIKENGGYVTVAEGAAVEFASNTVRNLSLSTSMTVHKNTVAGNVTVLRSGNLTLFSGGAANSTTVNSGGKLYASSGALLDTTIVNSYGSMYICDGASADNVTVHSGGKLTVSSGGSVTGLLVSSGFKLDFAVASNTLLQGTDGDSAFEMKDGKITGYVIDALNIMRVDSGGVASNTTVNSRGEIIINSGGAADQTVINAGGKLTVSSGGSATNVDWTPWCGDISVAAGAYVTFVRTYSGVILGKNNQLQSSAAVMNGKYINGSMYVMDGGMISKTAIGEEGTLFIHSGGSASNTVNSGGSMFVASGGAADLVTVDIWGYLFVSGGSASKISIKTSGTMHLADSGRVSNTTINAGGRMYVSSGTAATDTSIDSKGSMYISSGGVHRGTLAITDGAKVSAYTGATIDFTVADRSAEDGYLINNLALISGAPEYTITVAADQASGIYKLAQGAENFTGSISIGDGMVNFGAVTVNGDALHYNRAIYTLTQTDGNLLLNIEATAPAAAVMVYNNGALISAGEELSGAIIGADCQMYLYSGGAANETVVNSGGYIFIYSGGAANETVVDSGGYVYIDDCGTANALTVNSGGRVIVSSGGNAVQIAENGGYVEIADGANVKFISNAVNNIIVTDIMTVHKNCIADEITVSGEMHIYSGGIVNKTTITDHGTMYISSGGTADNTANNAGCSMYVFSAGTAANTIVNSGGSMFVASGGTATVAFNPWQGFVSAADGAVVSYLQRDADIYYGGNASGFIAKYDSVDNLNITSGNSAIIFSGGSADNSVVNSGGSMLISPGGTATDTTVDSGGIMNVSSGGNANGTLLAGADAFMYISNGGTADNTTVRGNMYVCSGGIATNISWTPGEGHVDAAEGANVTYTSTYSGVYLGSNNQLIAHENTISGIIVSGSGDTVYAMSDGTAGDVSVCSGGRAYAFSGGMLADITAGDKGSICISSGGAANNTTVNSGGVLYVSNGGMLCGTLQIAGEGAAVTVCDGATIDFTVANRSVEDDYLVNNLALISGTPAYTITVAEDQAYGIYKLAQGAENFTGTITIRSANTVYGDLSVNNGVVNFNNTGYDVTLNNGDLLLVIGEADLIAPAAPVITVVSDPENTQKVIVSAEFSDDAVIREYSLNNQAWQEYTSGIVLEKSGSLYFRSTDTAGNSEIVTHQILLGENSGDFISNPDSNGDVNVDFAPGTIIGGTVCGARNQNISGDVSMNAADTTFSSHVFAGIVADDGQHHYIDGGITVELSNCTANKRIQVAGSISGGKTAYIGADVNLTLNDVTVKNITCIGANIGADSEFIIDGNVTAEFNGGNYKTIYIGGTLSGEDAMCFISGDVAVTINSGNYTTVGNGALCNEGGNYIVNGNSTVTISNGTFTGNVYGGGLSQGGISAINGDSTVSISGGTFKQSIYAGSFANKSANGSNNSMLTTIKGDTMLIINAAEQQIVFADKVSLYAGSVDYGVVNGNSNLIISGKGENLIFEGRSIVMGDSLMYQERGITYIGGSKNLTFNGFTGNFGAEIFAFDKLNILNGSQIKFGVAQNYMADITSWNFEIYDGATALEWAEGYNNFAGDTLNLTFDDDTLESATLIDGGVAGVIKNWDQLAAISFNGTSGYWSDSEMAWVDSSGEWKVTADKNNDLIITKIV